MALNTRLEDGDAGWAKAPNPETAEGLRRYLENAILPGDFLKSLLTNDLQKFFAYADDFNGKHGREWVQWMHWQFPSNAYGSHDAVDSFIRERRAELEGARNVRA